MLCPSVTITREQPLITSKATIQQLINEMQFIRFYDHAAGKCHSGRKPYVPDCILSCSKVWVRVDRVKKSLEAPYSGPEEVVRQEDKYFILKLPQGETSVSIDRLKPAYISIANQDFSSNSNVTTDVHINSDIDMTTPDLDIELSLSSFSHDASSFFKATVQDQNQKRPVQGERCVSKYNLIMCIIK